MANTNPTPTSEREFALPKFKGRATDDYTLWCFRLKSCLQGKGIWKKLSAADCSEETKDQAVDIIVSALGDAALRNCMSAAPDPIKMIKCLDECYASRRAASRVAVLTSVFSKKYDSSRNMSEFIDEFNQAFAQLDAMGEDAKIPENLKAPILLSSFGNESHLEPIIAAMRMKDKLPSWESLSADLILEGSGVKGSKRKPRDDTTNGETPSNPTASRAVGTEGQSKCRICKKNHDTSKCWKNPMNTNHRLTEEDITTLVNNFAEKERREEEIPSLIW